MNTAFIFPGQGSQAVGMGKDLYNNFPVAREVFEQVNDSLRQDLTKIIFEGPIDDLTQTENTQPALMAVSMAFLAVIKKETKDNKIMDIVAGHSVGEYSALCAAGALSIGDAAKLLKVRGVAMKNACPKGEGAMAACLSISISNLEKIVLDANQYGICDIANDNTESQIVISGTNAAVDFAVLAVKEAGGKAIKLNVSGPFHSRLMQPAENIMRSNLNLMQFNKPLFPVVLNVTAKPSVDIEEIKASLVSQLSGRVRWREIVSYFKEIGVKNIVEIGSGKVLTNMIKKSEHEFLLTNVGNIVELESFLKQ